MSLQVQLVFLLTFVIHLFATLAYAIRIAGVRTGRIAVSFALANVLLLVARTSNTFQGPLLAKHVEQSILSGSVSHVETELRWLMLAATLATFVGVLLIPTAQRVFSQAIEALGVHRSVPRLLLSGVSRSGLRALRAAIKVPSIKNLTQFRRRSAPHRMLVYNALATALLTVSVFASLYAGCLKPELRVTANNLSAVVNGTATVLLFLFIDPYLSLLADDAVSKRATEAEFRRSIVLFGVSRLVGTVVAQLALIPGAKVIALVAKSL
jgi:Alternate to MurJ